MMRPPVPFYEAHDGGIVSSDGKCVYFIGIIDTLTYFGTKKKLEYRLKSVAYGNKTISCVPPKRYGSRFLAFMNQIFTNAHLK
jgi:1-phosphatidylinositol-4-phosphate 5-kinase